MRHNASFFFIPVALEITDAVDGGRRLAKKT
jgi:hypothetical protein